MTERVLDRVDAHAVTPERGQTESSCIMLLTNSRIVVAVPEGTDPKTSLVIIIGFGIILAGFVLMNPAVLLAGSVATLAVLLFLVLVNFAVRYRSGSRMRRLSLDEILAGSEKSFEVRYADIVEVVHESVRRHEIYGPSRFFLPSFQSTVHLIHVVTQKGKYSFKVEVIDADRILDLMKQYLTVEIKEKQSKE
jgi:hypothetical protein